MTLTKSHTEGWRERRIIKYKAMEATEVPSERGTTEIVCNSISNLYTKRLSQESSRICTLNLRPSFCHQHLCL
ncbi:MAG: hypothetical protein ACFNS5_00945 [Prevotella melaninogenica]